jgi:hypothetical protein
MALVARKAESVITGKTLFGRRPTKEVFDYEYDCEAEQEEGDDEVGEDMDDDRFAATFSLTANCRS